MNTIYTWPCATLLPPYRFENVMRKRLVQYFKRQVLVKRQMERAYSENYDSLHAVWQKKMDKFENSIRKRQRDAKYRECFEKIFPELRKRREEKERVAQKLKESPLLPGGLADIQAELNSIEVISLKIKHFFFLLIHPLHKLMQSLKNPQFIHYTLSEKQVKKALSK
jgi:hypothetical protein